MKFDQCLYDQFSHRGGNRSILNIVIAVGKENIIVSCLCDQCLHISEDRSSLINVWSKSKENKIVVVVVYTISVPTVEASGYSSYTASAKIGYCCCLYNQFSHRDRNRSCHFTVSAKSIDKKLLLFI